MIYLNRRLRVFEAFAGVGSQRMALRNIGVDHEVVAISEIDKFAIQSYMAIHGETLNLGDITKISPDDIPEHDLFTYSFPCQDISVAGKGLGLDEGGETRSGLLWECQKVIIHKKPKYLLLENVKNLVGKHHKHNFYSWLRWLEQQGYYNYWEVLNAKDYGTPQNRERVFVVSVLGEDIGYQFPEKEDLALRIKDILENSVEESFYLKQYQIDKIEFPEHVREAMHKGEYDTRSPHPKINKLGNIRSERQNAAPLSVFSVNGICNTLLTMGGGNREPHIFTDKIQVLIGASRGRNPENTSDRTLGAPTKQHLEVNPKEISNTLTTVQKDNYVVNFKEGSLRKLTPKECWRLMGFSDTDFEKANAVCSKTQLYKQAGNSIAVKVLEGIFKELFLVERPPRSKRQRKLKGLFF